MKYLIVNADDFGMSKGINEGIVKAVREGIVTSVSVLAAGGAFDDAVRLARANGIGDVGAHLSITEIPNLALGKDAKSLELFLAEFIFGRMREDDLRREFKAQIDRIRKAGFEITHLDSHEHIHLLPRMLRIFIGLARECSIPAIRLLREEKVIGPLTPGKAYRLFLSRNFTKEGERVMRNSGLFSPDHLLGFIDSGRLSEELLVKMLGSLEEGATELVAHPGFLDPQVLDDYRWHVNCEYELYALVSRRVRQAVEENNIKLISYKEALSEGLRRPENPANPS